MTVRLHVAAKKGRHARERLVVHVVGAQTFVVLLADVDVGNGVLAHGGSIVDLLRRDARLALKAFALRHRDARQHQRADHQQPGHETTARS